MDMAAITVSVAGTFLLILLGVVGFFFRGLLADLKSNTVAVTELTVQVRLLHETTSGPKGHHTRLIDVEDDVDELYVEVQSIKERLAKMSPRRD